MKPPKKPKYRFRDRPQFMPATVSGAFALILGIAFVFGTFLPFMGCAVTRKGIEHVRTAAEECADVAVDVASREATELAVNALMCARFAKTREELKTCAVDEMRRFLTETSPEVQACVKAKALDILGTDLTT